MKLVVLAALAAFHASAADTLTILGRTWAVPAAADWKVEQGTLRLVTSRGPLRLCAPLHGYGRGATDAQRHLSRGRRRARAHQRGARPGSIRGERPLVSCHAGA